METTVVRTNSQNTDFVQLVRKLDVYLAQKNGDDNAFYAQYNKIDMIHHVVVLYANGAAIACGAIKQYEDGVMEVKRMFTEPDYRGKGIATKVLLALESWAAEMGFKKCVLETGTFMPDAMALYEKNGYTRTENYGQYAGNDDSACYAKNLL